MIRAVVLCTDSVQALAHSLSDLVPGAVEGIVKRVTVAAPADGAEPLFEVADDAGAAFQRLDGSFGARAAAASGSGDWLLVLEAGTRLPLNWHAAAADHLRRRPGQAAVFLGDKGGLLSGRALLALLIPRALYDKSGGFAAADADLKPMLRRLGKAARL